MAVEVDGTPREDCIDEVPRDAHSIHPLLPPSILAHVLPQEAALVKDGHNGNVVADCRLDLLEAPSLVGKASCTTQINTREFLASPTQDATSQQGRLSTSKNTVAELRRRALASWSANISADQFGRWDLLVWQRKKSLLAKRESAMLMSRNC